ncbi:ABC-type phosphate/phosphonate transport system, permease component [Longilinea arvoryzae]|uniref:ABC-type phosphate/phosphonate transport system, permease component n=1 Tax=Longilinea arvoryzae TaxID=360412 RepID=A0A0S7BJN5_9CHLR|nr:ABC transporter permease subunit [Longilinea arvoryzae]GAP14155.1 ABC-type phosphate/phosphonate transport system, permease component [Longilinea arvoryzae]
MPKKRSFFKSLLLGVCIIVALVIYAYGFQVTKVNLDETRDPKRQTQLTRIIRALARPDVLEYDKKEFTVSLPVYVPCPESAAATNSQPEGAYLVMTPACADAGSEVMIEGFNFAANSTGPLNFVPPSGVSLQMTTIQTDANGHFSVTAKLPKRPDTQVQEIRVITRQNIGTPHFSQNAIDTWDKIIETVFMALLATTLGILIAIPASFLAARNIMTPITSPFTSVALAILVLPVGLYGGWQISTWMMDLNQSLTSNIWIDIAFLLLLPLLIWYGIRWAIPPEEVSKPKLGMRIARIVAMAILAMVGILVLYLLSSLAIRIGDALVKPLQAMGFLGKFVASLGDILSFSISVITALICAGILGSLAGRLGQAIVEHTSTKVNRALNLALGATAGATFLALLGAGIDWLYQIENPTFTLLIPAVVGGIGGLITAMVLSRNATLPIGFVIYSLTRTLFNGLRSIESLVMVIVFAVWVGIGPFAGVLALALHTIASNAKLYSEQVEAIMAGPLEAVTATGANRIQTIIYAVIPQIIPPYISYTMYRWDINVRMSTIIGFAGGGGIGFLLQQNINLLNYRAASAQMLAIAIVVASMDYLSSKLREKAI